MTQLADQKTNYFFEGDVTGGQMQLVQVKTTAPVEADLPLEMVTAVLRIVFRRLDVLPAKKSI